MKLEEFRDPINVPIVNTIELQRNVGVVIRWLEAAEPFILVGPEGSGKSVVIRKSLETFRQQFKTQIVTLHCNAQT